MREQILIIGAGGHATVVAETALQLNHTICGFLDDDESLIGQTLMGKAVSGPISDWKQYSSNKVVVGIGDNKNRYRIVQTLTEITDEFWITLVHPSVILSSLSTIGIGSILVAGSIVNVNSQIGSHCIINTGATVDHDCIIGNFAHIAPGVNLAGNVTVRTGAFIGIGAQVIPGCTIGDWAIVGAGATVISDIPPHTTVVGTPASPIVK